MKSKKFEPIINSKSYLHNGMYIFHLKPKLKKPKGIFIAIHGFPSWSSKNYDIAEYFCLMGYEVFVPHHKGLGLSKGDFSFKNSIADIKKLIRSIKNEKPELKISILGHSWGGFVSLHLNQYIEEHLILLAPLLEIPHSSEMNLFLDYFLVTHPNESKAYNKQSLKKEFGELKKQFNIDVFLKNLSGRKVLLLHGTEDDLIPISHSTKFAKKISNSIDVDYVEMNEDHRLSKNRNLVFEQINTWLKK